MFQCNCSSFFQLLSSHHWFAKFRKTRFFRIQKLFSWISKGWLHGSNRFYLQSSWNQTTNPDFFFTKLAFASFEHKKYLTKSKHSFLWVRKKIRIRFSMPCALLPFQKILLDLVNICGRFLSKICPMWNVSQQLCRSLNLRRCFYFGPILSKKKMWEITNF